MKEHKGEAQNLSTEIIVRQAAERLKAAGFASAALDARLLLQGLFGFSHADIVSGRARALSEAEEALYAAALARRAAYEPVHRILGRRAFYGREFALSKEVLEPRPDTEALIDLALPYIREKAAQAGRASLLDIGTGSGIIALTLLAEVPQLRAIGADISADALRTAEKNAESLGLAKRFTARQSDCFSAVEGRFDFIISNPPYIPRGDIAALEAEVRLYDPRRALDGGQDGLDFYRALAHGAAAHLAADSKIAVEIGFGQAADVTAIFAANGFSLQASRKDLSGTERALLFAPQSGKG